MYQANGSSNWSVFYKRGAAIFALSTLINIISGQIYTETMIPILNWSIFQVIGVCLILVPVFAKFNWIGKIIWISVPLFLSEWIYPNKLILEPLFNGFAPIFPWSSLFFAGMLICEVLFQKEAVDFPRLLRFVVVGAIMLIFGVLLSQIYKPYIRHHVTRFNLTSFVVYLGVFIFLIFLSYYFIDFRNLRSKFTNSIIGFGQYSITIYYLQLFGIVLSPIIIRYFIGYSPQLEIFWFLPSFFMSLFILHIVMNVIWAKFDHIFTMEWILARYTK
jgi:hypothetical protein